MKRSSHQFRSWRAALAVAVLALLILAPAAPAATDDAYLVGLWGKARIGQFTETWQGDDPARIEAAFGVATSTKHDNGGLGCVKRWSSIGLKAEFWVLDESFDPCSEGMFGRAQITSPLFHTTGGIGPGSSERKARKKSLARCGATRSKIWCGHGKAYVLSTHRNDCAGSRTASVVARVRGGRVSSLIVYTTGCE